MDLMQAGMFLAARHSVLQKPFAGKGQEARGDSEGALTMSGHPALGPTLTGTPEQVPGAPWALSPWTPRLLAHWAFLESQGLRVTSRRSGALIPEQVSVTISETRARRW